VTSIVMFVGSF